MTYTPPKGEKWRTWPMDNGAYGFPRGEKRRIEPFVLMCVHITGNKRTASMSDRAGLLAESLYHARQRSASDLGNSAHNYIGRDGSYISFYPVTYAGWNNGRLLRPNTRIITVRKIVELNKRGINPNEAFVREVECTGYPGSYPLTKEQRETVAYFIARDSIATNIRIDRSTVLLHADIDSVNRANCPFSASRREQQVDDLIARAREIVREIMKGGPKPDPEPEPVPDPKPEDLIKELKLQLEAVEGRLEDALKTVDDMADDWAKVDEISDRWNDDPEDEPST